MTESEYDGLADWEKELLGEYVYVTADEPAPLLGSVAPMASASTAPKFKYCNITPIDEPASVFEFFFNQEDHPFSVTVIEKSQRRAEAFIADQLYVASGEPMLISQRGAPMLISERPAIRADFDDPELKIY
jgi:hypothetical protein